MIRMAWNVWLLVRKVSKYIWLCGSVVVYCQVPQGSLCFVVQLFAPCVSGLRVFSLSEVNKL